MIAPSRFERPFINVMFFKVTLLKAFILKILDWPKAFIVKPLPLMVIGFAMVIPVFEKVSS